MRTLVRGLFGAALLAAALTPAQAEVRIVALGDDGIHGKGVPENDAMPAQLERALRAKGLDVAVANQGVDGDTTDGVLQRLDGAVPPGTRIVILSVGLNDRVLGGRSDQYIRANNLEIISRLKARGVQVHTLSSIQRGLLDRPELHVESVPDNTGVNWHLNAEGYAIVTSRLLPAIEALVQRTDARRER